MSLRSKRKILSMKVQQLIKGINRSAETLRLKLNSRWTSSLITRYRMMGWKWRYYLCSTLCSINNQSLIGVAPPWNSALLLSIEALKSLLRISSVCRQKITRWSWLISKSWLGTRGTIFTDWKNCLKSKRFTSTQYLLDHAPHYSNESCRKQFPNPRIRA